MLRRGGWLSFTRETAKSTVRKIQATRASRSWKRIVDRERRAERKKEIHIYIYTCTQTLKEKVRERESWPRIVSRASSRSKCTCACKEQVSFVKGAPLEEERERERRKERRRRGEEMVYPRPIIPPVFFFSVPRPRPTYPGIVEDLQPSLRPVLSGVAAGYRRGCCHGG